jgi:RNA recognition motif-containing protein
MDNEHGHDGLAKDDLPMENGGGGSDVIGSAVLRPVFMGNLSNSYTSEDVIHFFELPMNPPNKNFAPIPVDRVDLKRGYCFVFLKDAVSQEAKENAERFVSDINGMYVLL